MLGEVEPLENSENRFAPQRPAGSWVAMISGLASVTLTLALATALLIALRWLLPPLVENSRYSWHRGQLRAEYELAGQELQNVSLEAFSQVSQLVSQRVTPSVVHINLRGGQIKSEWSRWLQDQGPGMDWLIVGQGSGVLVDAQGHILTNHHVLDGGDSVEVLLSDGRRMVAELVGFDRTTDLAVLKIDADNLLPISWGDSERVASGWQVWAVGSPFGLAGSITSGIISGKHRANLSSTRYRDTVRGRSPYTDLIQTDVAVNPGNSGGPLVNARGELIGINTAILGENFSGVSFAIPSRIAKHVYEQIVTHGHVQRGWLGVALRPGSSESQEGLPVIERFADIGPSPAREAGLRMGDCILELNGQPVVDVASLMRLIAEVPIGQSVDVKIDRQGEQLLVPVKIGPRPVEVDR
jgi:serine protease Do